MEAGVQEQDRHLGQDQRGHVHHARALRLERRGQRDPLEPRLEQGPSHDLARVCDLEALVQGVELLGGQQGLGHRASGSGNLGSIAPARSAAPRDGALTAVMLGPSDRRPAPPLPDAQTIPPHGGILVDLLVPEAERETAVQQAEHVPKLVVNPRELSDLEMLTVGALSPLTGFVGEKDHRLILETMHLESGLPWSIPVTLSLTDEDVKRIGGAAAVALLPSEGAAPIAIVEVAEVFKRDRQKEALGVFLTEDLEHPGVAALHEAGDFCLAGSVRALGLPAHDDFPPYRLTPAQTRAAFAERGWRTVVGFQTRNPVHRAHEYIQKCALETVDGLLLHPLVGETKGDDIPADVRMRCYEVLLDMYYPADRVLLSVNPAAMRYAGPREAIFHALVRKNYGCTHFIVGRDHAGVGSYYGTYDAQLIFGEFAASELGIAPMFFDHTFFCKRCLGMASAKTCPHDGEDRVTLSGTQVREMLKGGLAPPPEFSRPEVADVLIKAMQERTTPHYAV